MKKLGIWILILCFLTCGMTVPALGETVDLSGLYKERDTDASWDDAKAVHITLQGSGASVDGEGAALENGVLVISRKGDYVLTGAFTGQIRVDVPDTDKVHLILSNVTVNSPSGPALYERSADKLIVTLAEETTNVLTSGGKGVDGSRELKAALLALDDFSINGSGSLRIENESGRGIQTTADLIIAGGTYEVVSGTDGIRGNNSVLILDGVLTVRALSGDGITSTETDKAGKGYVVIAGGTISVQTGEGAGELQLSARDFRGGWGDWDTQTGNADSLKGIKAATDLTVLGGSITTDTEDDGLHGVNVNISGGLLSIRSGDDGVHADNNLTISGGGMDIPVSFEGLEGLNITISGGTLSVRSSDDGINAAGSTTGSGMAGRETDQGNWLSIAGGDITIESGRDGMDSNGSISISGGTVRVYAMNSAGDGTVDTNGVTTISGGVLVMASTGGGARSTSISGWIPVQLYSGPAVEAGTTFTLEDENGRILVEFTPQSSYDTVMVAASGLEEGSTCTAMIGSGVVFSGTVTSQMTQANGAFGAGFGPGGPGQNGRNRKGW